MSLRLMVTAGATLALTLAATNTSMAAVYSLADQFSSSNNGSPWAYGYYTAAGTSTYFPQYSAASAGNPIEGYSDPSLPQTAVYGTPNDDHNISTSQFQSGTVVWLADQATFHPGQNGEFAFYRFTAPTTGSYSLTTAFSGRDFAGPTNTEVLINVGSEFNIPLFTGIINGYAGDANRAAYGPSPNASFDSSLFLTAGENVYFSVGFDPAGTRGSGPFYYDTTGVSATLVSGVPEPSTWAMMLLGFGGIGMLAWRKARGASSAPMMAA